MEYADLLKEFGKVTADNDHLRAKLAELEKVLMWYAKFAGTTEINHDYGKRACAALGTTIQEIHGSKGE